ncbi:ABC transporter substrate-binding protein [Natronomonas salina]|uniref:ABC transporter substrate-binding protein n=1 Tax=Natronomonas salina TaxID=1710540 RepID=UPI0015B39E56|nr:ABC transporter substrate-binding protein [Natronomonas salina]QLD89522.1 ABC transporter substrate-binding protein [Natronomonas salina]
MADVPENEQQEENEGRLDRRSVLKYGGTGALGAGLAGCQSRENPLPGSNIRPPESEDGGVGGNVKDAEGPLEGETFKIGVLAPMELPLGESMWQAAQMAAEEMNEAGGLLGASVKVELGDTEVSPGKAQSEHRRLTSQAGCDMTVGVFLGSALLQTMTSIANQQKLHVTTAAADPRVGKLVSKSAAYQQGADPQEEYEKYKYHFRAGPIHLLDLADAMLEFIEDKKDEYGWERAALLTEDIGEFTPYADRLQERLSDVIDVPISQRPGGVSDWSPLYSDIEEADCDVALIGMALGGTTAVNQWAQQQRDFEFGGIHVFAQSFEYWESTDGNVEHVFTMNAMTPQTENTDTTQEFVQNFVDTWESVPIYTAPITYDAISTIEEVFAAMHEEEGLDGTPEPDAVIPYLEDMTFTDSTILEEVQFTPADAEYAHEPQWTSIAETGVPVFQQWQMDEEIREDYGTMHSFYPPENKTAEKTEPEWL